MPKTRSYLKFSVFVYVLVKSEPELIIIDFYSFFPQTINYWNDLPGSLISSSELSDDSVSKFTSLVRARDLFPQSQPLVKDCQFGVSPVNYSDSYYPHGSRIIQPRIPPISVHPVNGTGFYVVHFGLLRSIRFLS